MTVTYNELLQRIVQEYREHGEGWPAEAREIAAWAIRTRRWEPQQSKIIGQCAADISRAMREEYHTDRQGRRVRTKHAARLPRSGQPEQAMLWADVRTASRDHMDTALKLRRKQIVGDCRQLSVDVKSYDENYNTGEPVQISFNFTFDLIEQELGDQLVSDPPVPQTPSPSESAPTASALPV